MNTQIPSTPDPRYQDDSLDFKRYLSLFLSNWYWFALALLIAGMIAYGINTYSEKVYTVSASLLIKDDKGSDLTGLQKMVPGGDIFRSQQNLQNEMGILKSFSINYRVMKELPEFHVTIIGIGRRGIAQNRHYKSAPFMVLFDTLTDERPNIRINLKINTPETYTLAINGTELSKKEYRFGENFREAGFDFTIVKRDSANFAFDPELSNRYIFWFNRPEGLANSYRSKLNIQPVNEEATLVTLSVSGVSPAQEADYLNKLMEVYIRQGLENKNQTAEKTIEFIDRQLGIISDSLTVAEQNLEQFRLANRLIDLSSEGASVKNRLEKLSQDKITASLQKQYYEYLSDYVRTRNESGQIVSPSVMGVTDPLLVGMVEELAKLQEQKKQLQYNISQGQPAISLLDSRIEDARAALSESVRNNILNTERTLKEINSRIAEVEKELERLPGTERRLINIQRTFDLNNTVYTYMLEKRSEAGIAKASNVSENRIIDYARPFNASLIKPKARRNYIYALLLGLMIPGIYILLVDQLHNKIIDRGDIEKNTDVPVIGFVGHNSSKSEMPVILKPGSSLAESFRTVRTNLKYYLNGKENAVISVTSTISGEGKTFFSLNLAAVLSMPGKKTILAGFDLRKPKLDKVLRHSGTKGLSNYLIGEADYDEIINQTEVENLWYVASGPVPPNPSELIETPKMKEFIARAKKEFDFVVFDTPPVGIVSDALLLGSHADLNIFVVRQRFSYRNTLELIQEIYERKELKNPVIAVNDIHISGYYGYGLRYGYGFYEGYGYNYGYGQYGSYGYRDYHKYYTED